MVAVIAKFAKAAKVPRCLIPVALALAVGCAAVPPCDTPDPAEEIRRYFVEEVGDPACSVAIVRGGEARFAGDEHAIYRIASLGKLFVVRLALELESEGRLDLDAPVTKCVKMRLDPVYGGVTLRDLMEHRSGLPRDFLCNWNPLDIHRALCCGLLGTDIYADFQTRAGFEREIDSPRMVRAVRSREQRYSNVGFALFTMAIEDACGQSVDRLMREKLCPEFGLDDTGYELSASQLPRLTLPCAGKLPWLYPWGAEVPEHPLGPALAGMGSLKSSAADCVKALGTPCAWPDSAFKLLELPSGRKIRYRFGMIYGGSSFYAVDVSTGDSLLILRNVTSWPAAEYLQISDRVFGRF